VQVSRNTDNNVGVSGNTVDFDCEAGYSNWVSGWSEQKKTFCCNKEEKGCQFDCNAGYSNWIAGWSSGKKQFCCETEHKGCDGEALIDRLGEDDGPSPWLVALSLLFGIAMCAICMVGLLFFASTPHGRDDVAPFLRAQAQKCQDCLYECTRSCRAPNLRKKTLGGTEWIFKPSDGRAVMVLSAPEFEAPVTGETLEPGEIFEVSAEQPPPIVEQPVPDGRGGIVLDILEGGEGKCAFLELADGRGWVLDREPGHEMCYKLFEPVDELWLYDPENGKPMAVRDSPFIEGEHTGHRVEVGEQFSVTEIQASEETGSVLYLKLADGRGWVFDQKSDQQDTVFCRRILRETWEYQPTNDHPIGIRTDPDIDGHKTSYVMDPGEQFIVEEIFSPDDGTGVLFLKLAGGRGWLFDKHPDYGPMCFRVQ